MIATKLLHNENNFGQQIIMPSKPIGPIIFGLEIKVRNIWFQAFVSEKLSLNKFSTIFSPPKKLFPKIFFFFLFWGGGGVGKWQKKLWN